MINESICNNEQPDISISKPPTTLAYNKNLSVPTHQMQEQNNYDNQIQTNPDASILTVKDYINKSIRVLNQMENANELAVSNINEVKVICQAKSNSSRIMLIKKKDNKENKPLDIEYIRKKIQSNKIFLEPKK